MSDKFYKKKKIIYLKKNKKLDKNNIVKFCVFAGRKSNLNILHKYIILLLNEKIIHEYHIFDFTRNDDDKKYLFDCYEKLKIKYHQKVFIHNQDNKQNIKNNKYDWSPFYKIISDKKFYNNSIIIKCDDDILFIDINGLKNAIEQRIYDKKSFLIHSNCINNNICCYYQKDNFKSIRNKLDIYPKGGILGPIFENPIYAYIMQYQFLHDCMNKIENIYEYYLKDIYINTRISINFILLNGEDCKYLKNTKYDDEYELSSYYPEKLCRPNKIIGNFITCHYSYSMQEKILSRKKELKLMYNKLFEFYSLNYKLLNYKYINLSYNKFKINKIGKNKFYMRNFNKDKYIISTKDGHNLYIKYNDNNITLDNLKKTYFDINFIQKNKIIISLGIYKINKYNLIYEFKNRNLLIKLLHNLSENIIILIPNDSYYYMMFEKSKLYININNNLIDLNKEKKTLWNLKRYYNNDKIYVTRYKKDKKFYYKNLSNDEKYTNFYLGWGCENIINLY